MDRSEAILGALTYCGKKSEFNGSYHQNMLRKVELLIARCTYQNACETPIKILQASMAILSPNLQKLSKALRNVPRRATRITFSMPPCHSEKEQSS